MRRLSFILVAILLLSACSGGVEKSAKNQMEKTFKELAKDPSSIVFTDVETKYSNDSICILDIKMSGKNGFGGVVSSRREYIYLISHDEETVIREAIIDLEEDESILEKCKEIYQAKKWADDSQLAKMTETEQKAFIIYNQSMMYALMNGRKIKDKKKLDDVDNW